MSVSGEWGVYLFSCVVRFTGWPLSLISRTIVNTEQSTYTFYSPPSTEPLAEPLAPFPSVTRYRRPNDPLDQTDVRDTNQFTSTTDFPLVTL
jgi:hypothetical protein